LPIGYHSFVHVNVQNMRLEGRKPYLLANFEGKRAEGCARSRRECPWVLDH
jgi:hypothetical protein